MQKLVYNQSCAFLTPVASFKEHLNKKSLTENRNHVFFEILWFILWVISVWKIWWYRRDEPKIYKNKLKKTNNRKKKYNIILWKFDYTGHLVTTFFDYWITKNVIN